MSVCLLLSSFMSEWFNNNVKPIKYSSGKHSKNLFKILKQLNN